MSEKTSITINFNMLTILFIGLKLTNHIDWPWVLVLAPTLIPLALFILFWVLCVVIQIGRRNWR